MGMEMRRIGRSFEAFAQYLLCAAFALAAAIADAKRFAKLVHRSNAPINRHANFLFRDVVAQTNNHDETFFTFGPNRVAGFQAADTSGATAPLFCLTLRALTGVRKD